MSVHHDVGTLSKTCMDALKDLGIREQQMPRSGASFVYIGKPSKLDSDPFFTCTGHDANMGPCNVRTIVAPVISSKELLEKVVDSSAIPFCMSVCCFDLLLFVCKCKSNDISKWTTLHMYIYIYMYVYTLDNHLKVFVSEEVQAVGAQLGRLLEAETFSKLKEDVLQRLHKSSDTCDPLRSILEIENTINKTFQKFMDITQSQPLVDLVN
ncbi:hypothetical protein RFI_36468, partial [Reticulomyxa filosa]